MLRSGAAVTLFTFFGGAVGFLNQIVIARTFGASLDFDAYLVAISVPMLVAGTISAGFSYSAVPALVRSMIDTSNKVPLQFIVWTTALAIGVGAIGALVSPLITQVMSGGFEPRLRVAINDMARVSWLTAALMIVTSLLNAMQIAARNYVVPSVLALFPYLATICCVLIIGQSWGPLAIVWGMCAGYVTSLLLLLLGNRHYVVDRYLAADTHTIKFFSTLPLTVVAMVIFGINQFVDAYWAPKLGEGALSYLGYAQRLLVGISALILAAPAAIGAPALAGKFAKGEYDQFLEDCLHLMKVVLLLGAYAAVLLALLATPTIEILFERGAFDATATEGVSAILPMMLVGMSAMVVVTIVFRALFAIPRPGVAAGLSLLLSALYFAFSGLLSNAWGLIGIATAYALSWWVVLVVGIFFIWKDRRASLNTTANRAFLLHVAATLISVCVATYISRLMLIRPLKVVGFEQLLLRESAVSVISLSVFYLISVRVFPIREILDLTHKWRPS